MTPKPASLHYNQYAAMLSLFGCSHNNPFSTGSVSGQKHWTLRHQTNRYTHSLTEPACAAAAAGACCFCTSS
jgi:hypothetical protein